VSLHERKNERPEQPAIFQNLFISNLPKDLKEDEFRSIFTPFGIIDSLRYNAEKGTGFVQYKTQ
jgi:RNA recognition motif-containing protein